MSEPTSMMSHVDVIKQHQTCQIPTRPRKDPPPSRPIVHGGSDSTLEPPNVKNLIQVSITHNASGLEHGMVRELVDHIDLEVVALLAGDEGTREGPLREYRRAFIPIGRYVGILDSQIRYGANGSMGCKGEHQCNEHRRMQKLEIRHGERERRPPTFVGSRKGKKTRMESEEMKKRKQKNDLAQN